MSIKKGSVVIVKSTKWTERHFGIDRYDAQLMMGKEFIVQDHDHDSVFINEYYIHKNDVILRSEIKFESKPFHFNTETLTI
jgi:hypothetical protein